MRNEAMMVCHEIKARAATTSARLKFIDSCRVVSDNKIRRSRDEIKKISYIVSLYKISIVSMLSGERFKDYKDRARSV